jgi:hypothetical protein
MDQKIIRDPVYDYISIDGDDRWLLDLLDTPEMQRLRYIHQLGVSYLVYPGATHTRFSHSLGVMHLMKEVLRHLECVEGATLDPEERDALLAVAVVHDVGHGPFSHLLESQWGGKHEGWSIRIIQDSDTGVSRVLQKKGLVDRVAALLGKEKGSTPYWQRSLISSQLDVDRMDYLMRDSHFTGVRHGSFDFYRLIHTMALEAPPQPEKDQVEPVKYPVWPDKTKYALEEYVFARYYMYQSVYFHRCTRGYEKLLQEIWRRARQLLKDGVSIYVLEPVSAFLRPDSNPTVTQYVRLQEYHVLSQLEYWSHADEPVLADLSSRFLCRRGFKTIPVKLTITDFFGASEKASKAEEMLVRSGGSEALAPRCYLLRDEGGVDPYEPYQWADIEAAQPIFLEGLRDISMVLERLKNVTKKDAQFVRYYCPEEHRDALSKVLSS